MFEAGHISVSGDRVGRYSFLLRVIFIYFVGILFLLYLACVTWTWLVDSTTPLDKQQQEWVNKAAEDIRVELAKDAPATRPSLVICDFSGEPTGVLTDTVRGKLGGKTQYIVKDRTVGKKIRDFLHLLPKGVGSSDEAAAAAREQGADLALFGVCERLTYDADGKLDAILKVSIVDKEGAIKKQMTLLFGKSAKPVEEKPAVATNEGTTNGETANADEKSGDQSATSKEIVVGSGASLLNPTEFTWQKFLGWVFFVLFFPILTIYFLIQMTRKESNSANAMMLILYTIIDGVLAWFLFAAGMWQQGLWGILLIVALGIGTLIYNLQIMAFARKIGEEA